MAERYIYFDIGLERNGIFESGAIAQFTERHGLQIDVPQLEARDPVEALRSAANASGVVISLQRGYANRSELHLARIALKRGLTVFFHWPFEKAVERIDSLRLSFYGRLRWVYLAFSVKPLLKPYYHLMRHLLRQVASGATAPLLWPKSLKETETDFRTGVQDLAFDLRPAPLRFDVLPGPDAPIRGLGAYLRLDFWAPIASGGSYGHTVYVARALARVTEKLVCFMANRFSLMDELGIDSVLLEPPGKAYNEYELLRASELYYLQLRSAFAATRPAYIYERLVLGNYVGARLSREFGIPYIVEYNGSEISMAATFGGHAYAYEDAYLKAEDAAFRQASLISVISEHVKADLVGRGIDPGKILVNPNGVDPDAYNPGNETARDSLRASLGFKPEHRVVCFTGTFGGWHGVDVLAQSLAPVCKANSDARFLLIGDGQFRHLVDDAIARESLSDRVVCTGRVPQARGAELLRAADIFVSPHSSHMVDSRFFGSPTKLFEYMGVGKAIVASDLEQIGEVLRPAIPVAELDATTAAGDRRAVLCAPGNVEQFIKAVQMLVANRELAASLGANARAAALKDFTWDRHVENLWRFARGDANPSPVADRSAVLLAPQAAGTFSMLSVDDPYKTEAQRQWNTEHCGAAYADEAPLRTKEWFREVERYRYGHYAPWMPEVMEFARHRGERVLEIGGGLGTDLAQFASNGALVTDLDLAAGHLDHAQENFMLRGLSGQFIHHDGESLPFADDSFDVVYSNGVIHHTPNTEKVVREIHRVLKPGGRAIVMVYAENSYHFWRQLVFELGVRGGLLRRYSIGEIMSRFVEISRSNARPLVKVYTGARLREMFGGFESVSVMKRQLLIEELPRALRCWVHVPSLSRLMGWNLVVKAIKPRSG